MQLQLYCESNTWQREHNMTANRIVWGQEPAGWALPRYPWGTALGSEDETWHGVDTGANFLISSMPLPVGLFQTRVGSCVFSDHQGPTNKPATEPNWHLLVHADTKTPHMRPVSLESRGCRSYQGTSYRQQQEHNFQKLMGSTDLRMINLR